MKKQVSHLINKLKLSVIQDLSSRREDFRTLLCKDLKGRKLILKVLLSKEDKMKRCFQREYIITKILSENRKTFPFKYPILVNGSLKTSNSWLLRSYTNGKVAGTYNYGFSKEILSVINPVIFTKIIRSMQVDLSRFLFPKYLEYFSELKKHNAHWYLDLILKNCQGINKYKIGLGVKPGELLKVKKIINKYSTLLNKGCQFLSHGDMFPSNFLMNSKKKVIIFDWEQVCIDNIMSDFATVWISLKSDKRLQKIFYNSFFNQQKKQKDYKILFCIDLLQTVSHIMYSMIFYFFKGGRKRSIKEKEQLYRDTREFYKIFTKTLQKIN